MFVGVGLIPQRSSHGSPRRKPRLLKRNGNYLPSLIEMPDIKPSYVRGTQPLGSSLLEWVD